MKYYELDQEEKEILKDYDQGKFSSIKNLKQAKARYKAYAKASLNKNKNVNIRLSEKDLQKTKAKAVEKGIPYQTLMSSLIHQYVNGQIKAEI